jgi:hypothetical protein
MVAYYGLTAGIGGVLGGMAGETITSESPDQATADRRQDLLSDVQELQFGVGKKQAALDLLDDVKPQGDTLLKALQDEITADRAQITTLTATAKTLHAESSINPVGVGVGATVGVLAALVVAYARRPSRAQR